VLVPGTCEQLGALGLFPPPAGAAVVLHGGEDDGGVLALAADEQVVWLDFAEVARAGAAGLAWTRLAAQHALWVVAGVPVLDTAPRESAAFLALAEVLHAADVPLVVIAREDPGPLRRPLPVQTAHHGVLPPLASGS
jgi:hypothetical protein